VLSHRWGLSFKVFVRIVLLPGWYAQQLCVTSPATPIATLAGNVLGTAFYCIRLEGCTLPALNNRSW